MATEPPPGEQVQRAARTYSAAADHYRRPALGFWDRSGYRATVDALSPEQRDRVREGLLANLRSRGITWLRTDVVFGTAVRPG